MNLNDAASLRRKWQTIACAAILALISFAAYAQNDPPDQAGRISYATGTVSIQPAGSDDWGQLYPNLPIGPGDRIFTDQDGQVEIQIGQSYLRVGPNTDITLVNDAADGITFGVAQGSVRVHSFGLWDGQALDVSTPNGDGRLDRPGEFRADILPDQGATVFTTPANDLVITGAGGFWKQIGSWQALELTGTNPVYPQWLQLTQPDSLDAWSQQRDQQIVNAVSDQYVSAEIPGAADLDRNGDWIPDSDYGPIWIPRNVQADWQPYHNGHWVNRDPWGWVWVEDEPWGYAPFHYGRWVSYQGRWGWIPGPREQHPVWSPALVVFAGGGGAGVSAWFPLGPGEVYRPWYPCSPRYIDRVNISNIRESRDVHVQTTYVNIVNIRNLTNITYVNRLIGVTAMRQDDFAAGRGAQRANVAVDRRQFDHVQLVDQPAPVTRQSFISRPVAHPVQVAAARPMFINHQGMQITTKPGAPPQAPPVRPVETVRTLPGRTVVAQPSGNRNQGQPPASNSYGQQPGRGPVAPGLQPTGRPMPPAGNQQEGRPNPQQGRNPVAPEVRPAGRPMPPVGTEQQGSPSQANPSRPNSPTAAQPTQPAGNSNAPTNYRQDFGPVQATKHGTEAPPPANNPQTRPNTPPPPANGGNDMPKARQEPGPQEGIKSTSTEKPNKDNKKEKQNKDDKKKDN
jgi:hypothetical protein